MKYKIVGALNLFFGLLEIIVPVVMLVVVIPGMAVTYEALEANMQSSLIVSYLVLGLVILTGLTNIFLGTKLFSNQKEKYFNVAVIFLFASWVLLGFASAVSVYSTMAPTYNLIIID